MSLVDKVFSHLFGCMLKPVWNCNAALKNVGFGKYTHRNPTKQKMLVELTLITKVLSYYGLWHPHFWCMAIQHWSHPQKLTWWEGIKGHWLGHQHWALATELPGNVSYLMHIQSTWWLHHYVWNSEVCKMWGLFPVHSKEPPQLFLILLTRSCIYGLVSLG